MKSFRNQTLIGLLCLLSFHSGYSQGLTLSLNPPGVMLRDSSYTVPILVSNFNNVGLFQFEFFFNKDNLELTSEPSATYLGTSLTTNTLENANTNGRIILFWFSLSDTLNFGNGTLLNLIFNVRSSASIGLDTIKFSQCLVTDLRSNSLNPQFYNSTIHIITAVEENASPNSFSLDQNYPNPFNPSTTIRYRLSMESFVRLTIFDVAGKEVALLVHEKQQAGDHSVTLHANTSSLSSGVYFYKLDAGAFHQIRKMILLK